MRITTKERMLRHQLDTAVTRIHAALSQCPADLENLDPAGLELAAALVDEQRANGSCDPHLFTRTSRSRHPRGDLAGHQFQDGSGHGGDRNIAVAGGA